MWSNISAPKSALKAAKVGQQKPVKLKRQQDELIEQQENQSKQLTSINTNPLMDHSPEGSPLMRYKHAVCSSPNSGFIYVHGGRFANGMPLDDDVWRFDAHENSWLQLATSGCKPPSLQEHTLSEHREHLYLFGGQVSAASGQEHFFWRLDLAKRQWISLATKATSSSLKYGARLGPTNRRGHTACVYRDSIYIFGGYEDFRGSSNQLWQYDLLNERWELRNLSSSSACHPEPRHNHSAIIYQDDMYIYGGLSNLKPLGDLWRWSWRDKRWFRERTRGRSPGQLHGHSAVQAFGSMFVFGGERQSGRTTCSLWRLNLSNLCWKKIKPRGPRPNPTTWHAAIANPLGILDEANYLIEGDVVGAEFEQEQQPTEQLTLIGAQNQKQSMSDNYIQTTMQQQQQQQQDELQQTKAMELIRPTMPISDSNHMQLASTNAKSQRSRLKVSRSSCEQMSHLAKQAAGSQLRPNTSRPKRRLRLSFLRRNRKQAGEVRQLPISKSAASISTNHSLKQLHPSLCNSKRNSMETDGPIDDVIDSTQADVHMELDERQQPDERQEAAAGDLAILDSLDTDIKQMFQRALSPAEPQDGESRDRMTRDSITQSSLAPTLTQTYQTARDHLSSQSTMTITLNEQQQQQQAQRHTASGAAHEQRKPAHHQTQPRRTGAEAGQRRGRPKSEIVQSLIDRADARIKNACMPLFNPEGSQQHQQQQQQQQQQQLKSRFGSNELSILGELANHRMFERPKRHTIHQTMTYYNLYFADERRQDNSSSGGGDDDSSSSQLASNEMATAGRSGVQAQVGNNQATSNSLSAALEGVRDGGSSSGGDLSQKTMTLGGGRLESEVGSLMQSSDSRTLCNDPSVKEHDPHLSHGIDSRRRNAPGTTRPSNDELANGFDLRRDEFDGADMNQHNNTSDSVADNTSLSFSVIAEFEEDDILQYSSPMELNQVAMNEHELDERSESVEQVDLDDTHRQGNDLKSVGRVLAAQKSTSSGYESIQSNQWLSQQQAGAIEGLSPSESALTKREASRARPTLSTASASSTTAESLALTTTNDTNSEFGPPTPPSRSLPSSPPDSKRKASQAQRQLELQQQQQQPRHSNSFASSLMSGPSRLFGKRRIKTRYWQLCMFVIGGKQQGGQHNTGNLNEPITIWRLYI